MRKRVSDKYIREMRSEYSFDYQKARPNRFAGRLHKDRVMVVLDADIAKVFTTAEAVNKALRALITAMPKDKLLKRRKTIAAKERA